LHILDFFKTVNFAHTGFFQTVNFAHPGSFSNSKFCTSWNFKAEKYIILSAYGEDKKRLQGRAKIAWSPLLFYFALGDK
jgi:hypothetical protein